MNIGSTILLFSALLLIGLLTWLLRADQGNLGRQSAPKSAATSTHRGCCRPKPAWVRYHVLKLQALSPHLSCREIEHLFNSRFRHRRKMTVGHSFVAYVLRDEAYRIAEIRRQIRKRRPGPSAVNKLWALDLTYLPADRRPVLGLVDHGSRACSALRHLRTKSSIAILRAILDVIERCGTPSAIRTDNEACFTSRLFSLGLVLLGIKHQRTEVRCPWQNGRIERFFGTFKQRLRLRPQPLLDVDRDLRLFRNWYNHVRPHSPASRR